MKYRTPFFCIAILLIIGCANNNQNDKSVSEKVTTQEQHAATDSIFIKIYVEQDGKIIADGNDISLNALDSSLSKIKESNGVVYYSRANAQGEPPEQAMQVMELIVKYSLPVKMFTDKTFTVVVTPN